MAYETKALMSAIGEILILMNVDKKVYDAVARIANSEGTVLKPYDVAKGECKNEKD